MFLHLSQHACTGADTPLGRSPGQTPPVGRHPHPRADTPTPGQTSPLQQTATAADGTHPTGMHSCFCCCCLNNVCDNFNTSMVSPKSSKLISFSGIMVCSYSYSYKIGFNNNVGSGHSGHSCSVFITENKKRRHF